MDARLDLRVERLLKLHRKPREVKPTVVRAKVSVLTRALEWEAMIRQPGIGNRAGLAAKLGVSRARITQGMAVLAAPEPLLEAIRRVESAGGTVTEGTWRRAAKLSMSDAVKAVDGFRRPEHHQ